MAIYTDQLGAEFTVKAGIDKTTGERSVSLDGDLGIYFLDADQARQVAHELQLAADAITGLIVFEGGNR